MGWTAGLSRMEPVCDRLFYIFRELSKQAGAPPDVGRAACWIVEQRYPHLTEAERAMLAKLASPRAASAPSRRLQLTTK